MDKKQEDYYRDNRTPEKFKADYKKGKEAEDKIIKRLEQYFGVEANEDTWGVHKDYEEDCQIWYGDVDLKVEIKFTKAKVKTFQWKKNQADKAIERGIHCLYVAGGKVGWIAPTWRHKEVSAEESYCNKPCYEYYPIWFKNFKELFEYLIK